MQKTTTAWAVGDPVTAAHLNQINTDLDTIFKELSAENLSLTYNVDGYLTQVVDNENSVTINLDWSDFNLTAPSVPKLYIQKAGDPAKWTISYGTDGNPSSIVYA